LEFFKTRGPRKVVDFCDRQRAPWKNADFSWQAEVVHHPIDAMGFLIIKNHSFSAFR